MSNARDRINSMRPSTIILLLISVIFLIQGIGTHTVGTALMAIALIWGIKGFLVLRRRYPDQMSEAWEILGAISEKSNSKKVKGKKISKVGTNTGAGLACPKCGGTSFKAKRSAKGKVAGATVGTALTFTGVGAVAGGLVAPKSQVRCVTCGTTYKRG